MATRVLVAMYAWITKRESDVPVASKWINCSEGGLPQFDAMMAEMNAGLSSANNWAVTQWHVYFEDGGHARYRIRYDMVNAWEWYSPIQPDKAPVPLSPKPEWEVQEGI